ncbi:hypothetical protein [Lichenibacterium minor]|jgi:hypothetical protein|nr:hypothetical protein [Lichenibacterium minor]
MAIRYVDIEPEDGKAKPAKAPPKPAAPPADEAPAPAAKPKRRKK